MNNESKTFSNEEINELNIAISGKTYDFGKANYFEYNERLIASFDTNSVEDVISTYLKNGINKLFGIRFTNRNEIMNKIFSNLRVLKNLSDFTIIRFDFKKYFDSVSTQYIFERYFEHSNISREDKGFLKAYVDKIKYCTAGLTLSNTFCELISQEFDLNIQAKFQTYGVIVYERYVDDGIFILSSYISEGDVKAHINSAINEVFFDKVFAHKNKTKLNFKKFRIICRRDLQPINAFDFLGYEFSMDNQMKFTYGITQKKIDKYSKKIKKLIEVYNNKPILLRHIIKANSSRVVYYRNSEYKYSRNWISKGLTANYTELRLVLPNLDAKTNLFLENIYCQPFLDLGLKIPGYLKTERYRLKSNFEKNRAMIFDERIGISKNQLIKELQSIGYNPMKNPSYNSLVKNYLIEIKIGK